MTSGRLRLGWLVVAVLGLCVAGASAGADGDMLWRIGTQDDAAAEFRHGPGGYNNYDADGRFVVGESDPAEAWPYCHPGPADLWAGGSKHTFDIYFALDDLDASGARLAVDLVDTHAARPPLLVFEVNGRRFEHQCPKGASDDSIKGNPSAGKEHRFAIDIPAGALREGLNKISITNTGLSWIVYDWLGLEVAGSATLTEARGGAIKSVNVDPWLTPKDGKLVHRVYVNIMAVGEEMERVLSVKADGTEYADLEFEHGEATAELALPPVEEPAELTVKLSKDGETLDSRTVTREPVEERELVDYVDPMLGTSDSRWMLYPGPSMPFGMVKLSPDNQRAQWKAGYDYAIENITGFSHLHSWTMGGLLTMPTGGEVEIYPGSESNPDKGYRSPFRHETEQASPGYYGVTLDDHGIRAELTSTTRAGFQRYTFPKLDDARIQFDLNFPTEYGFNVLDARITKVSDTEIEGYSKQRSTPYNEYTVHFVAKLSKPFESMGGWDSGEIKKDIDEIAGDGDIGVWLNYTTDEGEVIKMKTGISLVSIEQARLNLETEMAEFGWDFDAVHQHARQAWAELLRKIEVEGGTEEQKVKFYTNLYRSYCSRTIWSDVNGKYVDMYEKVQQLDDPESPVYGCDAFWNTFWNLNQLWTLVNPELTDKWVRSLLEIYRVGGWLPKGPTGIEYSSIMVASHEIPLIVSAYQKGIRNYDVQTAWEAMKHIQTTPGRRHEGGGHVGNMQLAPYMELGYVPVEAGPVSNTLEYAYDDWCVAQMAKALGKEADYQRFMKRAQNYRNVFDPSVKFARQKHKDGKWVKGFDPFSHDGFVEGNSWQYTWFVPHDLEGLAELMGGRQKFIDRLNEGFLQSRSAKFVSKWVHHGNQPNMQAPYLFNYVGAPWLTQKWVREVMNEYYGTGPLDGYPGDEDQGQMGAWYVMSAMGLFQMKGGASVTPVYEIGSPIFDRVVIHLDTDYYPADKFVIEARNNSPENVYVQSAVLDGRPLQKPWFTHSDLVDGGKLVLHMGPDPNKKWGK